MSTAGSTSAAPLDLRLVPAALTAWATAWLLADQTAGTGLLVAAVLAVAAGAALLLGARHRRAVALLLAVAAAAACCTAARAAPRTAEPLAGLVARGAAVDVEVVLLDDPRRTSTRGRELLVVPVRLERLRADGRDVRLRARATVLTEVRRWSSLLPGQRLALSARLARPRSGDAAAAVLTGASEPRLLGRPPPHQRWAGVLRQGLRDAAAPLPEAERGLLPGLVVGDTSALPHDLREDFRATGLSHLTAVSGANVAIVLGALLLLCRAGGVPLRLRPVLGLVALGGFVVLARPSPSVLRAAVMGAVGLLALATGDRRSTVPALAAAVLGLVLLVPELAAAPGFALSVLATGGIVLLAPAWTRTLSRRLPLPLAAALAVPAAAQAACGPVVAALTGSVALLGVPANLLAVPAVAPATVLGVGCVLLAPVWLPAAQALAWLAYLPTAWLVLLARRGAQLPGGVPWPQGTPGALLLAGLTLALLGVLARPAGRRLLAAATAGGVVAAAALVVTRPPWPPPGWLLVVCDVGQGDAVVVDAGPGAALVVDAGPEPRAVDGCLRRLGVERVPLLVLTHLHADHVDGLPGVLQGRQVDAVEVSPSGEPEQQGREVREQLAAAGLVPAPVRLGAVRRLGELRWTVLGPPRAVPDSPNDSSVVLRVEARGVRALLPGDAEPDAQRGLLGEDLRADVLKVPHHGSRYQSEAFLDAVRPAVVLTSSGAGNSYGHPDPGVLARLTAAGAASLRTDLHGDLAVVVRDGRLSAVGRG